MQRIALCLIVTAGCMSAAHVRGGADGISGGGVSVEGPMSMMRLGVEMGYDRVRTETESERRGVVGFDYTLRFGLVSKIQKEGGNLEGKPWVEFGPAIGFGIATNSDLDLIGHALVGSWLDVRIAPTKKYPVIRVEVQHDAYTGAQRGETQLVVGLGWVDWDLIMDLDWP